MGLFKKLKKLVKKITKPILKVATLPIVKVAGMFGDTAEGIAKSIVDPFRWVYNKKTGTYEKASALSAPDTAEEMVLYHLREQDRRMNQAIQALAMDRMRMSLQSLSRETQFQSRPPIEPFSYSPLYIPSQNV